MKDVFGRELKLDQIVATNIYGYTDRLVKAKVIGFTLQKVRVELISSATYPAIVLKFPQQLCIKE